MGGAAFLSWGLVSVKGLTGEGRRLTQTDSQTVAALISQIQNVKHIHISCDYLRYINIYFLNLQKLIRVANPTSLKPLLILEKSIHHRIN